MILEYCIKNRYNYKIYSYYFKQSDEEISYIDNTTDSIQRIKDHKFDLIKSYFQIFSENKIIFDLST